MVNTGTPMFYLKQKEFFMYKIKFNQYQKNIFKEVDFNGDKKRKIMSVYSYLIKYSDETGVVTKSLTKLHKMYLRYHKKMSLSYFKQISLILIDLKLIKKIDDVLIIIAEKIAEKIANQEVSKPIENTSLECNSNLHNNEQNYDLYTNTNIVKMLKGFYKGLSGRVNATKKDLQDIAKCLFVLNRVDSALVQHAVFSKIKYSKRNINLAGAVAYVEAIVMEKLGDYEANFVC